MKEHQFSIIAGRAFSTAATVASLILLSASTMAQRPTQPVDITNQERLRQQSESEREWQLRNLGNEPEAAKDPKRLEEIKAEIEQDFQRILILHNELARFLLNNKPLNYDFVSEATAEIKKRASRLQRTLALTKPDDEQNKDRYPDFADTRMRDEVAMLCNQIKSFVTNPVIEKPGTVNAPQLMQARRDLQDVIDLSGSLKKSADRLKKTSP
jgi:hypothetical protein